MKEAYVSFEVAKLLKEKGFDWRVFNFYDEHGGFSEHIGSVYSLYNWNYPTKDEYGSHYCSAPTQQMACRWLMEEKHIFIGKSFTKNEETLNLEFYSPIFNMDTCELITTIGAFCPEDAIEAALQYCLTNLI